MLDDRSVLTGALSDLHIIVWKFLAIDMVKVDTEGLKFDGNKVWVAAIRRLASRIESAETGLRRRVQAALSLGRGVPPIEAHNKAWEPLLYFEYTIDYQILTHYSDPYLELLQLVKTHDDDSDR